MSEENYIAKGFTSSDITQEDIEFCKMHDKAFKKAVKQVIKEYPKLNPICKSKTKSK